MNLTESPCPEDVFSLRLTERAGSPVLLMASMIDGVPHARESGGAPFRLGPRPQSVHAEWDVRGGDTVVSLAGSSICNLFFQDGIGEISTSEQDGRPVYQNPRFVRDAAARWRATAISNESPDVVVLLERGAEGRLAVRKLLDAPKNGDFREAVLLRSGAGFVLIHTSYFQGSVRPDATGALPYRTLWVYETVRQATVVAVPLQGSLEPAGPASRPFGDALVYQLDAAPLGDGRAAVFATTSEGYRVAMGDRTAEGTVGADLTSPTILACGGSIHLAAIATRGSTRAIVRASLKV